MKFIERLKLPKVVKLAEKYLNQDYINGESQGKYQTRLAKESNIFVFKNSKVMWLNDFSKEESLDYPRQVCEIAQLHKNKKVFEKIIKENKVYTMTLERMDPYYKLTKNAIEVYRQGKDNPDFDSVVSNFNDYIKDHFGYRLRGGFHKTFKIIKKGEMDYYAGELAIQFKLNVAKQYNQKIENLLNDQEKTL